MINEYFGIKLHDSDDPDVWLNPPPSDDELDMNKVGTEITGRSMVWKAGSRILCSHLTSKYTMLTRVGLFNWFPSLHQSSIDHDNCCFIYRVGKGLELNLGDYVFRQIVSFADHITGRASLPFPSLIFELLKAQHPIHSPEEPFTELKRFQIVQHRFLKGNRVVDIQGESSIKNTCPHSTPTTDTPLRMIL